MGILSSAKQLLTVWDIPAAFIRELHQSGNVFKNFSDLWKTGLIIARFEWTEAKPGFCFFWTQWLE
jgi:hypothetical protein